MWLPFQGYRVVKPILYFGDVHQGPKSLTLSTVVAGSPAGEPWIYTRWRTRKKTIWSTAPPGTTWGVPKIGVPQNHPNFNGIFSTNHPFCGTPNDGNPHIRILGLNKSERAIRHFNYWLSSAQLGSWILRLIFSWPRALGLRKHCEFCVRLSGWSVTMCLTAIPSIHRAGRVQMVGSITGGCWGWLLIVTICYYGSFPHSLALAPVSFFLYINPIDMGEECFLSTVSLSPIVDSPMVFSDVFW